MEQWAIILIVVVVAVALVIMVAISTIYGPKMMHGGPHGFGPSGSRSQVSIFSFGRGDHAQ